MVEIPNNLWPQLVPALCHNITNQGDANLRESSFEALGFVCEEAATAEVSQEHSTAILIAIQMGMRKEETNLNIKRAATESLANSLEFVKANFEREVALGREMRTERVQETEKFMYCK